jgi:hypothetical protein
MNAVLGLVYFHLRKLTESASHTRGKDSIEKEKMSRRGDDPPPAFSFHIPEAVSGKIEGAPIA